jgi:hypothetical protein
MAGANVVDAKLLEKTIEAIVVDRSKPTNKNPQHYPEAGAHDCGLGGV